MARWGTAVIASGSVLQLAGLVGLAVTLLAAWPHVDPLALAPALVVVGAGQGLVMPALFRVVLSEVPVAQAGAGSGILATSQQVSLALGVATLGSLYVTVAPVARLGVEGAVLLVLAVQGAIAVGVAVAASRLPTR